MDGPTLHEAVSALLAAHHRARLAADAEPLPPQGHARFLAEHRQRYAHLCLDRMEEALNELAELCDLPGS